MMPTSRVRFGQARVDVTPPVGIYHRMWGAARHDRATGVHRPLLCDVLVIGPVDAGRSPMVRVQIDLCGLMPAQHHRLVAALARAGAIPAEQVVITYSHTHSAGWQAPDRVGLPGGEFIGPYLLTLEIRACEAAAQAMASTREVTIEYAVGCCSMAANRDYWDDVLGRYTCGFNPHTPADQTLVVGRISDPTGRLVGTLVNYGCHPTTLGWENTLLSPDYVGSLREEVERATGQPCVFLLGACGDLGPRHGFVGDP
ncbi:MAG: neutral/alkaline non-lysosomal ceramidase N-terminal domain-containing protein, partial [Chloroflexota bacterium]